MNTGTEVLTNTVRCVKIPGELKISQEVSWLTTQILKNVSHKSVRLDEFGPELKPIVFLADSFERSHEIKTGTEVFTSTIKYAKIPDYITLGHIISHELLKHFRDHNYILAEKRQIRGSWHQFCQH